MRRVLLLDSDSPSRLELVTILERASAEVVLACDEDDLVRRAEFTICAAIFADADLLSTGAARLVEAVRNAIVRPMLIVATSDQVDDLDAELVALVIKKPYDAMTLADILLAAVTKVPEARDVRVERPAC